MLNRSKEGIFMASILCIEDEPDLRRDIVEELREAGYDTLEASNGIEGLAAIRERKPNLILCDVNMPKMSGHQLLAEMRSGYPEFADTPFLFLSALADREDIQAGRELGPDDYLTKPVDFEVLLSTVKARLDQISRITDRKDSEFDELRQSILQILPHELRTPLNHILGFSEFFTGEMLGPLGNKKYVELARDIQDSGRRLLGLIDDTLTLADITTGSVKPEFADCDVRMVAVHCYLDLADLAVKQGVEVKLDVRADLPLLRTDEDFLRRIISALLSNAIKFSPDGEIVLIRASIGHDGRFVLTVQDRGIGIPSDEIPRLFKVFSQSEQTMTRKFQGAGIGLPMVRAMMELLGGVADLKSIPGKGTSVFLTFPAAGPETAERIL